MSMQSHWEHIYQTKAPAETSWYTPHLHTSLRMICNAAPSRSASIIDIGGGESTMVDDLLANGYSNLTILDISSRAIEKSQTRLGPAADSVRWLVGDITRVELAPRRYEVWHDRAAFHFLTEATQRAEYLCQLKAALRPGGHVVLATFAASGPERCSGLAVHRYDAEGLQSELGPEFQLLESLIELHTTPTGGAQQFQYGHFVMN